MALILKDRVQETSTTTGTGTLTLAGAVTQFQTFSSAVGNGNTTYYTIYNAGGTEWEVGIGTVGAGTLARTTVLASSNAGSLVNFTGTLYVFGDYPADKAVYVDASGAISQTITNISGITTGITTPDYVTFDITPETVPTAQGSLYWDSADSAQTLSLVMEGGNAIQQIGEESYFRIKCSSAITEGQVIMFTGTVGASGGLTGAPATGLTADTASYVMGVATESGALNDWIYVTNFGLVRGVDTTGGAEAWVDGQILYYDPTVTGGLTKTLPASPNAKVQVCAVVHAASNGSLFIRPAFGGILGQYEGDVQVTSPANGDVIIRNQTSGKWVNAPLTAGSGISVTNSAGGITIANTSPSSGGTVTSVNLTASTGISVSGGPITGSGSITVTNTAPDQTVVLTAGTGISTSGTYPNFTIANTGVSAYPGAGIPNSTGSAWGTSYTTTGTGTVVALATTPSITNPTITNYVETLYAPSAGSSFTVDLTNGTVQKLSLNANGTITLPSSTAGKSYVIIVTYSGAYTLTWAGGSTIKWPGGTAPTASSASGKFDIFTFFCDGTNTYGNSFGLNY